jgi:hypothetical protein
MGKSSNKVILIHNCKPLDKASFLCATSFNSLPTYNDQSFTTRIMQGGTLLAPLQWEKAHLPAGIDLTVALLHKILVAVKTCLSIGNGYPTSRIRCSN